MTSAIAHHPGTDQTGGTFDLVIEGERRGYLSYTLPDRSTMQVDYVEVDPSLRGQKVGERLVAAAVEWARSDQRQIAPRCSYARAVLRRTAAYQDVLKP
jgi:predicted GNAT family acetyltransferase